jgi:hypothetical protein
MKLPREPGPQFVPLWRPHSRRALRGKGVGGSAADYSSPLRGGIPGRNDLGRGGNLANDYHEYQVVPDFDISGPSLPEEYFWSCAAANWVQ